MGREKTQFKKGYKGGPGRPKLNPVDKETRRIIKDYAKQNAASYLEACEKLLPLAVDRAHRLLSSTKPKNENHHVRLLEVISDRVYGRPAQAITGAGGGPIVVSFQDLLGKIDGGKTETFKQG